MAKTYVIPDIHGYYDLLLAAMTAIQNERNKEDEDTLVFLGDYVDRGPNSADVVEYLRHLVAKKDPSDRFIVKFLMGNHEQMMLGACRKGDAAHHWIGNGGNTALISYGHPIGIMPDLSYVPKEHLDWMETLLVYYADEHRVYVHAGVNNTLPLESQNQNNFLWMRYDKNDKTGYRGKHVIHGHTPYADGPHTSGDRTMLDTGSFFSGRLTIAVCDDDVPGPPQRYIEIRKPMKPRDGSLVLKKAELDNDF